MVKKEKPMGWQLNINQRKKLIYLYEQYIKDWNNSDDFFTESAVDFDKSLSGMTLYSKTVNFAMNATWRMQEKMPPHKRMTIKEAKEILEKLKEEEKNESKEV